jgi:hypothetical protein
MPDVILEKDEFVAKSGRILRPYHKEILDALPEDIVSEIARRRLEQLEKDRQKRP